MSATEIEELAPLKPRLFLAYPSEPPVTREAMSEAATLIGRLGVVDVVTWEDLQVDGRLIISQVLEAIDGAMVCAFEISTLNHNVLFELGYAIARRKIIWLLLDNTDTSAKTRFEKFELLKQVGYCRWSNSEDLVSAYAKAQLHTNSKPLFDDLIAPSLDVTIAGSIFYLPTFNATNAAKKITQQLDRESQRGIRLQVADPSESSLNTIQWLAGKVYECQCTIIHFDAPRRQLADLHNPRGALVAGFARGLDRALLMLAEDDYSAPLDYEGLLQTYDTSSACRQKLDQWLRERDLQPSPRTHTHRVRLATELRSLRFGEHVAENEIETLADYFIETAAFDDVIAQRNTLFVGRKGTGKTANMYQAASRLSEDVRNLVVVIKPASYEFASLLALLSKMTVSMQQYALEGLWQFLLTSELVNRIVEALEARQRGIPYTEDEKQLIACVDELPFKLRGDFGARFERTVSALEAVQLTTAEGDARGRDLVNEALHTEAIARFRALLGPVLKHRERVAILIDNLDKGWERSADLELLAKLLLGLLSATGRMAADFAKEDYWRDRIRLSVATFIRSDIFAYIRTVAREPDKIKAVSVAWTDARVLLRVIEERFLAARPPDTSAEELWTRFFCKQVRGLPTRDYLVSRVLPRPRDFIYLCNAAVGIAANRSHSVVEEGDVLEAERTYSQFAFEALLVENGITIAELQVVLFEFLGEPASLDEERARHLITKAGIAGERVGQVLERLRAVAFLGIEVGPGRVEFPEAGSDLERANILARKLGEEQGKPVQLVVHPAFRAYLEIKES